MADRDRTEGGEKSSRPLPNLDQGTLDLEEALNAKLGEIVPEPARAEITQVLHEVVASFQGPLPPPSLLERYDEINPGAADRIIAMAEKEQAHRHGWERDALSAERWYSLIGLLAGWTTAVALALGATFSAIFGDWRVGVALAAASATGMVWKLVQGRSEQAEEQPEAPKKTAQPPRESRNRSKRR